MSTEFVQGARLMLNGKRIVDINKLHVDSVPRRNVIKLLGGTGFGKMTPRYTGSFTYVEPANAKDVIDFSVVDDGTIVILCGNDRKETYTGVRVLEDGGKDYTDDKESENEVKWAATGYIPG
jgi:hypothetical protein